MCSVVTNCSATVIPSYDRVDIVSNTINGNSFESQANDSEELNIQKSKNNPDS
jgi:hypothetical protein